MLFFICCISIPNESMTVAALRRKIITGIEDEEDTENHIAPKAKNGLNADTFLLPFDGIASMIVTPLLYLDSLLHFIAVSSRKY
jgi:hypothetical protein